MKNITDFSIALVVALTAFMPYSRAQNNNYPFDVATTGKGSQSIIFIPGFACSGEVWNDTKQQYENGHTCYTLTMAGFAGVPPLDDATFQQWEKGIARFIQQNKIDQPIIIGHSMGGGLAMALAADYPGLISKIIVVDALPCLAALMNPTFKSKDKNDCTAIVAAITSATDEQFYKMQQQSMPRLLADTSKLALVVGWSVKSDRKTFGEMYCDFSNTDLRDKIAAIKCPALILLEAYFVNFRPAINEQFKNLQTASLQYATKGLHFIMYDDKEWYYGQLKAFINQ